MAKTYFCKACRKLFDPSQVETTDWGDGNCTRCHAENGNVLAQVKLKEGMPKPKEDVVPKPPPPPSQLQETDAPDGCSQGDPSSESHGGEGGTHEIDENKPPLKTLSFAEMLANTMGDKMTST